MLSDQALYRTTPKYLCMLMRSDWKSAIGALPSDTFSFFLGAPFPSPPQVYTVLLPMDGTYHLSDFSRVPGTTGPRAQRVRCVLLLAQGSLQPVTDCSGV